MFHAIMDNTFQNDKWNIMNKVKRVPVIPGVCMVSIIQMAEYFEVPFELIKKYTKGDRGTCAPYNKYPFESRCVGCNELAEFALSKKKIKWNGLNYWELQYKDFKTVAPNTGLIMYSPYALLGFLICLQDESRVAREIIVKIIKKFKQNHSDWNSVDKTYGINYTNNGYQRKSEKDVSVFPLIKRLMDYEEREELKKKVLHGDSILIEKEEFCQMVGQVIASGLHKDAEKLFDEIHKKQYATVG